LSRLGFQELRVDNLTQQLGRHYGRVRAELTQRYDEMTKMASQEYVDRMLAGLENWTDAEASGHLAWGILHFRNK
jgi:sarcosine/dimethylglycine N-methyltransferase